MTDAITTNLVWNGTTPPDTYAFIRRKGADRVRKDGQPWGKGGLTKEKRQEKSAPTAIHETGILDAMGVARSIMNNEEASEAARVSALKAYTDLHARHQATISSADVPAELVLFLAEIAKPS